MVCYVGKQEKPFWFSSLAQMVQFGALIFCRTFKNYFGQFVWIEKRKQAGTGPSRRHIQSSKIAKRLPSVKYSFTVLENRNFLEKNFSKKLHTQKNGPSGAKVSQYRKTERVDPLRYFNIHSVAKHEKIEENKNFHFREKISMPKKTERGDLLGFFNIHSVAKKCRGDPLGKKFF